MGYIYVCVRQCDRESSFLRQKFAHFICMVDISQLLRGVIVLKYESRTVEYMVRNGVGNC